ncbi:AurF N-oxygenase family protein [Actinomadura madurae]|uniref:AurF N-oxygenase family protein n=1 Tax=Actinomadura madurae TaxID=1993 RepID=UPI0020D25231|nr:diiron oxygenase [Actinomadura madurae]MCP9977408.1 diiron oxygenase [Actinomadura madurae]MCQ0011086.1 diiron oxygenase [Actinomadura madurae]MCQ0013590.1 diiron oxygenase [Actinomadura madurae]
MSDVVASYGQLLDRLNRSSAKKQYQAFKDIAWDDPEMAVEVSDPGWELTAEDPLGADDWYRRRPPDERRRIGLSKTADMIKMAIEFENVLQRGLLQYAATLPNRSTELTYLYHEIAEETQHTLMFQEFINRTGIDPEAFPGRLDRSRQRFIRASSSFPHIVFTEALVGEEIFDHIQRRRLKIEPIPPILRVLFTIHVTEEARHRSFARAWLRTHMDVLTDADRRLLGRYLNVLTGALGARILLPGNRLKEEFGIPDAVMARVTEGPVLVDVLTRALAQVITFGRKHRLLSETAAILPTIRRPEAAESH